MNPQTTPLTSFTAPALLKTSSNHDPLLSQALFDPHEDLTAFTTTETSSSNVGVAPQFAMTFLQYLEESESSGNSGYYEDESMGEIGFNPESFVFSDLQQQQQYQFVEDNISNNMMNTIPKSEKLTASSNFGQSSSSAIPQPLSSGVNLIPPEVLQQQQLRHELRILGVPSKSRVETQLKLCIQLVQKHAQQGNTSNITSYRYLLLPENYTVGSKTSKKDIKVKIEPSLNCLRLEAGVVCASDSSKEVARCFGCIQRERKITQRKKKIDDMEESTANQGQFIDEERKKILQFYANSQIDFSFGETILPTRITCYCRHHEERTGFQIWIVLRDSKTGQPVAAAISPPVMITDDHKSKAKQPQPTQAAVGMKRQRLAEAISAVPVATPVIVAPAATPTPTPFFTPNPVIPANFNIKKEEFVLPQESPIIEKIIPSEGPVTGGIEVTILGKDFIPNQNQSNSGHNPNVIVLFGECEALKTSVWGSQTLVSVVPPSLYPGAVPVSIKGAKNPIQEPVFFTYKDDTDRMMMELALQVVGVKLTGKIDDAKQIALKIVNSNQDTFTRAMQLQQQQQGRQNSMPENNLHFYHKNTEDLIFICIKQLFENHSLNGFAVDLNKIKYKGTHHTMLMLAVIQGAHNLAELCLTHGADVNLQDANGYTALHYAAMHGYIGMTKLLLAHNNVDLSLKTITGKTAMKIAQEFGNFAVVDLLNHYMLHGNRFSFMPEANNAGSKNSNNNNFNMNLNVNVSVSYTTPTGTQSRRASISKELVNPTSIQIPLPEFIPTLHPAHSHPLMQDEKDEVSLIMDNQDENEQATVPKTLPENCRTEHLHNTPSSFTLRPFGNFFVERRQLWTVVMAVVVGTMMVSVVLLPLSIRNQDFQKQVDNSGTLNHGSNDSGASTTAGSSVTTTGSSTSEDVSLKFLVLAVYFLMAVLILLPLFYRYRRVWKVKQVLYGLGILLVMFGYLIFQYWGDESQ